MAIFHSPTRPRSGGAPAFAVEDTTFSGSTFSGSTLSGSHWLSLAVTLDGWTFRGSTLAGSTLDDSNHFSNFLVLKHNYIRPPKNEISNSQICFCTHKHRKLFKFWVELWSVDVFGISYFVVCHFSMNYWQCNQNCAEEFMHLNAVQCMLKVRMLRPNLLTGHITNACENYAASAVNRGPPRIFKMQFILTMFEQKMCDKNTGRIIN